MRANKTGFGAWLRLTMHIHHLTMMTHTETFSISNTPSIATFGSWHSNLLAFITMLTFNV